VPCKDRSKLTPPALKLLEDMEEYCQTVHIPMEVMQTLRTQLEQEAYYARSREPLAQVNAKYARAGLAPITEEQNKAPVTWTLKSRHLPNAQGLSMAFDIAIRDPRTGKLFDPKVDADCNGMEDWRQLAEWAMAHGPDGTRPGYFFKDAKGRPRPDPGHFEVLA
jgi:hypothetical protein